MAIDLFSVIDTIKTAAAKVEGNNRQETTEASRSFLDVLSDILSQIKSNLPEEAAPSVGSGPCFYTHKPKSDQEFVPPVGMSQEEYEAMPKDPLMAWRLPEYTAPLMDGPRVTEKDVIDLYLYYMGREPTENEIDKLYGDGQNSLAYIDDVLKRTQAFHNAARAANGESLLTTPDGVAWCSTPEVPGTTQYKGPASYGSTGYVA